MAVTIRVAQRDDEIASCYPVMAELRPHLQEAEFVATMRGLAARTGLRLAYLSDGDVKAVAGYRVSEWLHAGKYLEIEDLVTTSAARSRGYGGHLFDWLVVEARHVDTPLPERSLVPSSASMSSRPERRRSRREVESLP